MQGVSSLENKSLTTILVEDQDFLRDIFGANSKVLTVISNPILPEDRRKGFLRASLEKYCELINKAKAVDQVHKATSLHYFAKIFSGFKGVKINFAVELPNIKGKFELATNTILIAKPTSFICSSLAHTLIHEVTHKFNIDSLDRDPQVRRAVERMVLEYGFQSPKGVSFCEFVSQVLLLVTERNLWHYKLQTELLKLRHDNPNAATLLKHLREIRKFPQVFARLNVIWKTKILNAGQSISKLKNLAKNKKKQKFEEIILRDAMLALHAQERPNLARVMSTFAVPTQNGIQLKDFLCKSENNLEIKALEALDLEGKREFQYVFQIDNRTYPEAIAKFEEIGPRIQEDVMTKWSSFGLRDKFQEIIDPSLKEIILSILRKQSQLLVDIKYTEFRDKYDELMKILGNQEEGKVQQEEGKQEQQRGEEETKEHGEEKQESREEEVEKI